MRAELVLALALAATTLGCPPRRNADRSDGAIPELLVPHVRGELHLDGHLDEALWSRAAHIGGFVNPATGRFEPGSRVNGDARVAWSLEGLLVGFEVNDREAVSPAPATLRDAHVWEASSGVEVMLQPGDPGDNRDYFEVQVSVAGARWTTHFDDYNAPVARGPDGVMHFGHEDWEPALVAGTSRTPTGYVVEMRIPWESLAPSRTALPPHPGEAWRVNLYTFRDGQADALAWSPTLRQGNFHKSSRFGRLIFRE